MLTDNKEQQAKYVDELSHQFIGSEELASMLKRSKDASSVSSKKVASIYNSLGNILLKLYDQEIDCQAFTSVVSKELSLTGGDELEVIHQIFTLSLEESRYTDFTKADAHDGLRMVRERQLKQEYLEEPQIEDLLSSISKHKITRDEINKVLKRDGKYEGSAESDIKVSASTYLEEANTSTAAPNNNYARDYNK